MSTWEPAFSNKQQGFGSPPLSVVLAITLLIFFIFCFFSLFFCRCLFKNIMQALNRQRGASRNVVNSPNDPPVNPGLDQKIIQSFPSFPYSHVGDYPERYGLECTICISEYSDDDTLRLLTDCYHAFHKDCVDLWLQSHKTCPVCRSALNPDPKSLENVPVPDEADHGGNRSHDVASVQDAVSILIGEGDSIHEGPNPTESSNASMNQACENEEQQRSVLTTIFSRSYSTGRSLVSDRVEDKKDEYKLRLPEHVLQKITRCHTHTKSCFTFGELTRPQASNGNFLGETSVAKT